jgi:hypothetical protein
MRADRALAPGPEAANGKGVRTMKLVARVLAALAILALATPALACGEMKQTTTASTQPQTQTQTQTKAAKPVAKSDKKAESKGAKAAQQPKAQTAQN